MKWIIWYAAGNTVTSQDSTWEDAPSTGVQVVRVTSSTGRKMIAHGADGYILVPEREEVWGIQLPVPELQKVAEQLASEGRLKFGQFIPNADYERIVTTALRTES